MAKYNKEIVKHITDLIKKDSYTIEEICDIVDISGDTYFRWIKTKPDFSEAVKKAQDKFNDKIVADAKKSLAKKVLGYEVEETKTVYSDDGTGKPKIKERSVIKKHFQPDTAAIIFTLCNRDSENWKNRQSTELSGRDGNAIEVTSNFLELMKQATADDE